MGLRAKCYAFSNEQVNSKNKRDAIIYDTERHLRCKGIKTNVVNKELNKDLYKNVLFSRNSKSVEQNAIRSYKHQLFTETINKVALSSSDDKVYICDNNINTYNFGHYKTNNNI